VPPGIYRIYAWEDLDAAQRYDPGFLKGFMPEHGGSFASQLSLRGRQKSADRTPGYKPQKSLKRNGFSTKARHYTRSTACSAEDWYGPLCSSNLWFPTRLIAE
jgi:hypothetical protein